MSVDLYLEAADRKNTRLSYASALRHFEVEWGGFLPATSEAVARYLAAYGGELANSTLRQRLAALARWHQDQGFQDPTKSPLVRQVLKGIRAVHTQRQRQAKPLALSGLETVDEWLAEQICAAEAQGQPAALLRHRRDRALILLGFWRGFRSDELARLEVQNVDLIPGQGLRCYLPRSKGDREMTGRSFRCPSLSRLCPVSAYAAWIETAGLTHGPVFRRIGPTGQLAEDSLHPGSLIPLLRKLFAAAGLADADRYSSHSLRRGFAGWAHSTGWDLKELMEYVGWRDLKSAMRYMDVAEQGLAERFERGL
ncbi:site-specific integrase [Zoogloea sp.]|uniref:site-specific integrase n=1 Tax=Zoogloea sp. TaxID=49181 RepID=UPI0035AFF9F6